MDTPFLGMIIPWPIGFAPRGWAFCEGQELNIQQNSALYSLIGGAFGGNGSTTFKLPDLRGRMIMGAGTRPDGTVYNMGQFGGAELVTLRPENMPKHNHTATSTVTGGGGAVSFSIPAKNSNGNTNTPANNTCLAVAKDAKGGTLPIYDNSGSSDVNMPGGTINVPQPTVATSVNYTGADNPTKVSTVSPYLAIRYIIALEGLYPTRD